ncbi:hypothetical protein [uncultured Tateyamaria sp.]|nr:hypothetical protein [uncultured Tateyamaria sp.]
MNAIHTSATGAWSGHERTALVDQSHAPFSRPVWNIALRTYVQAL